MMDDVYVNRYDIVTVPYPYDDNSAIKVRPALCLTNETGPYRHVVLAFISSRIPATVEPSMIVLTKNAKGFNTTGLKVDSVIMLHRLVTIPSGNIISILGELPRSNRIEVADKLKQLLHL